MGWSIGYDSRHKRDVGYGVPAICDHPGCNEAIDRGLSYVCGTEPFGGEHGCGLYFCSVHRRTAGPRRDTVDLCARCYTNRPHYPIKPDVPEWMRHKLTDESWARWRLEHPDLTAAIRLALEPVDAAS